MIKKKKKTKKGCFEAVQPATRCEAGVDDPDKKLHDIIIRA
jgi:hypothetical protein